MAITASQAQGLVLALFGASAGGHLTGLTSGASLSGVAADLVTASGLVLGKDLSSNTAFRDLVLTTNLKLTGTALTEAQKWMDGEFSKGTSRADILAAAVTFLDGLTDNTNAFYATAAAYRSTVANAVIWSQGAGATVTGVADLMAQQGTSSVVTGKTFSLTAGADSFAGTAFNDTITGGTSATSTSTTFNSTDNILDTSTTDNDSLTLTIEDDVTAANSGIVRNIETINVNANATTLPAANSTALDFAATNFSNAKTLNFDVTKAVSAVNTLNVTALAINNAKVNASDDFATVTVAGTTAYNVDIDAKALGTSGAATAVTVTGALADVNVNGAGYLSATSNASTGLLSATAAKNLTVSGTAAQVISATSTGGNVTISDATASVSTTVNATGDVSISKLDAAGKVTVKAGGTITLAGTTAAGTDLDTTSANLSGVGTSTIGDADAMTSLTISGNGGAATYDMTAGAAALADVAVTGDSNVTLKLNPAQVEVGSAVLNVADSGSGTFTLELKTGAGDVDVRSGAIDKLLVNVDNTAKTLSVKSGQTVTYKVDQTADTILVGAAANAASNSVTVKLDDEVRDTAAVDIATSLTVSQAKNITIDASVDTTSAGSANLHSIKTLSAATVAGTAVTINLGVNNLDLATAGATTVGTTGTITVNGSGTLTDSAGTVTSLTASSLDASAMTGAVTLDSTTTLAVNTIKTGSANDTIVLTTAQDQTVQTNAGNDTVTLGGVDYSNKAVSIDLGDGTTDVLKVIAGTQLIKGTSGSLSLNGVETIQFANTGTQQIQASLLNGKTYAVSNAVTGATQNVGVIVGATDTAVDLSLLAGSTATESSVAAMTFTADASANTTAISTKGVVNAKNEITGSSVAGDSLVGGGKDDLFDYSSASLLFASNVMLDTINGGAGNDAIKFTATGTAVTVAAADSWANASNVEKITTVANTAAISLTLGATAQTEGINAIDLSGDTDVNGANVINVSAFTSGVTITGAAGASVESITGGSGNDTIVYKLIADINNAGTAFIDTVNGGDGTDTLQVGTTGTAFTLANTVSFARVANVETLKAAANTAAVSMTVAANAYTAGIRTIDASAGTSATSNVVDATAITGGGVTLLGSNTGATAITGGTGNDTITGGSANDTITGGDGADSISLTAGGNDTVVLNRSLTSAADSITGFTAGTSTVTGYDILTFKVVAADGTTITSLAGTDLVDAAAIATNAVAVTVEKITEFNLIFSGTTLASATDGTGLLNALKAANGGTAVTFTQTAGAGKDGYFIAYQDSKAYLYYYNNAATDGITADEIALVGVMTSISAGTVDAANVG